MISYFLPPITNTRPARNMTLEEVYEMITSEKWAQTTRSLRSLRKEEQGGFKQRQLPFVTFSGRFAMRHADGLICYSGLMCFDFDHVGDESAVRNLQQRLIADPTLNVSLAFRSPSGDGLKLVVNSNLSHQKHNSQYAHIASYIQQRYNIDVDHTNDIARACFLCHDPNAYIRLPAVMSSVGSQQSTINSRQSKVGVQRTYRTQAEQIANRPLTVDQKLEYAIQCVEAHGIDVTTHYHDWYRIGMALASHYGEIGRDYYHRISRFHPCYSALETNQQYDRCLRYNNHRIKIGTLFYLLR